jgi:hypothetical protein
VDDSKHDRPSPAAPAPRRERRDRQRLERRRALAPEAGEGQPLAGLVEVPQVGLIAGGMVGQPLAEMRDAGLVEGLEAVAAGLTLRS